MKKLLFFLVFILFSLLFTINTSLAQWTQTSGPEAGNIFNLACKGSIVFCAPDYNGVYKSTNNGQTWAPSGLIDKSISNIFIKGNYVFALDGNIGMYRSSDDGKTWTNLNFTYFPWSIVVHNNYIFFSTSSEGIFRSSDNGVTWKNVSSLLMFALTSNGTYLYGGAYGKTYRSSDNGLTWTIYTSGIPADAGANVMIANGKYVYLGIGGSYGIYRSTDYGITWSYSGLNSYSIRYFTKIGNTIFASTAEYGTQAGIFRTTDNGISWVNVNTDLISNQIISLGAGTTYLFVGLKQMGVSRSVTKGDDWVVKNSGLKVMYINNMTSLDNELYTCNTGGGIYYSNTNGTKWTDYNIGLTSLNVNCIFADKSVYKVYAGTQDGIFYTSEIQDAWTPMNNGLGNLEVISLVASGNNLYAGKFVDGIYRSTDGGSNWFYANLYGRVNNVALGTNVIYATTRNTHGKPTGAVYYSTDDCLTWISTYSGNVVNTLISKGNDVFWGTSDGVYRSTNKGVNWVKTNNGLADSNITTLTYWGSKIVAGTISGKIYSTTNKGNSWISISTGLLNNKSITSLITNNSYLFSSQAYNSVWKYNGTMDNPLIVKPNINNYKFDLKQNFPNPFNPITLISYEIPMTEFISLKIYDFLGREITTLVNEIKTAGSYNIEFDGSKLASGVYFYKLVAGDFKEVKRMILVK